MVRVLKSDNEYFFSNDGTAASTDGLEQPKHELTTLKTPCLEPSTYDSFNRTQTHSNEQEILWQNIQNLPLLKLKLQISSLMHQFESILTSQNNNYSNTNCISQMNQNSGYHHVAKPRRADFVSLQITEKMKASNFPVSLLRIGSWERVCRHEGDLVAKCYYAKKKLVWEFLERSLKRKIEIQWADILAIRATIPENEPAILELELKQPPTFHHEINPQPRKHTNWRVTTDFTEGQAFLWRIHYLKFPPGALDRHFEKLLQCDSRLLEISQKPFPSLESPHFQQSLYGIPDFSLNFNPQRPQVYRNLHYPQQFFPNQYYFPAQQVQSYQPIPHSFSFKDSASPNSVVESSHKADNPRMAFWASQAADEFAAAESIAGKQVQAQFPIASTTPLVSNQNNNHIELGNMRHSLDAHQKQIDNLDPTWMTISEMECLDDLKYSLEIVESFSGLINQSTEGSLGINHEENYAHDICNSLDMVLSANEPSTDTAPEQFYQQPVPWMPHQVTDDIPQHVSWMPRQVNDEILQPVSWLRHTHENPMSQFRNSNSFYQMRDDFSAADNNNGMNRRH